VQRPTSKFEFKSRTKAWTIIFSISGEQGRTPLGDAQPPLTQERVRVLPLIGIGWRKVSVVKFP
jgi:hypothetical protein